VAAVQGDAEPDVVPTGAWKLHARWLRDTEKFNEWMNEIDYEPEGEEEARAQDLDAAQKKRALSDSEEGGSKRRRLGDDPRVPADAAAEANPKVTRHETAMGRPGEGITVTDLSQLQKTATATVPADPVQLPEDLRVVLPSYASWFDLNKIDPIELRSLPEFFNGRSRSKTPEVYKEYRKFMVETYRLHPFQYLTITACRRALVGDVCAIARAHAFLEHWGILNYEVDNETRPVAVSSVPGASAGRIILRDGPSGTLSSLPCCMYPLSPTAAVARAGTDDQ